MTRMQQGIALIVATCSWAAAFGQTDGNFEPTVVKYTIPDDAASYCDTLAEAFPSLPGFRMPLLVPGFEPWPTKLGSDASPEMVQAAEFVSRRLAVDGLPATLAGVLEILAPPAEEQESLSDFRKRLMSAGLPVDLLDYYEAAIGKNEKFALGILERLTRAHRDGARGDELRAIAKTFKLRFRQSAFESLITPEMTGSSIPAFRIQLTRGDDWLHEGDGGSVDIARQLVQHFPLAEINAVIEDRHLADFLATSRHWPAMKGSFNLVTVPFAVTQWAQDNGRSMQGPQFRGGRQDTSSLLAPRFASRREEGSLFIPGDSLAISAYPKLGKSIAQSPLLFQGGNIMGLFDQNVGIILLVGEAEIARNVALGLTRDEVIEAFRIEFGAKECRVLPAVSFHIDFDLTVRTIRGKTTAFVSDEVAGAKLALKAGVLALARHEKMEKAGSDAAVAALNADDPAGFLSIIGPVLAANVDRQGRFSESFAKVFSTGPADSHVGNLRLFLVAMDIFVHRAAKSSNPLTQAYLASFERIAEDRRRLHQMLADWGWKVVPVPAFGEGERTVNPINGIQLADGYLMPTVGGLYAGIDDAAEAIFSREMGPETRIIRIRCAESQRRAGGLHCAVSVQPTVR